jgi:hypothetical protein
VRVPASSSDFFVDDVEHPRLIAGRSSARAEQDRRGHDCNQRGAFSHYRIPLGKIVAATDLLIDPKLKNYTSIWVYDIMSIIKLIQLLSHAYVNSIINRPPNTHSIFVRVPASSSDFVVDDVEHPRLIAGRSSARAEQDRNGHGRNQRGAFSHYRIPLPSNQ